MKETLRKTALYGLIILYTGAGINHFINPAFYENIMPAYIPFHALCISLSGICEITFAALLIPARTRKIAAWLIIAMLIVFFTVHIQMLLDYWRAGGALLWIAILRIPIQFVLIWWAYTYTKSLHQPAGQ
jgi:uncharacterized membrane protein